MEMKKIVFPFKVTECKEDDNGFFTFEGYANTWQIDKGRDRTVKGCFSDSIAKMKAIDSDALMPVLWQHDMSMPIGIFTDMYEDDRGLYVKGKLPLDDTFVTGRARPQMKVGSVRKMSIGYITEKYSFEEVDGKRIRVLERVDLIESSLVTFPMNDGADVTMMKGATRFTDLPLAPNDTKWSSKDAIKRVREFAKATEKPNAKYRSSFFWYDNEDQDSFDSYKLPFADIVDGELKAIPRAIFAAAAALRGARGGVDIPESDVSIVEAHVNRYYSKMERETPLKKDCFVVSKSEIKYLDVRELEGILNCENMKFTANASKFLISCLNVDGLRDESKDQRDAEKAEAKLDELIKSLEKKDDY